MISGKFGEIGEYIIPVLAGAGIPEPLLGLQWLKMLPLAVNFTAEILTLG